MKADIKKFLIVIILMLFTKFAQANSEIILGLLAPFSGEFASIGKSVFSSARIALNKIIDKVHLKNDPMKFGVSAISCGLINNRVFLDLDYNEDSNADADANFVFNNQGKIIEIQCTGEKQPITSSQFSEMFKVSKESCLNIFKTQLAAVKE